MKPLQDLKYIKLPASTGYRTFDEFLDVNNISENEINEHIINTYIKTTKSKIFRYEDMTLMKYMKHYQNLMIIIN